MNWEDGLFGYARTLAFIQIKAKNDVSVFDAGLDEDTSVALIKAVICFPPGIFGHFDRYIF
jgi:hypothetical protein